MSRKSEIEDLAEQLVKLHIDRETLLAKEKELLRRLEAIQSSNRLNYKAIKSEERARIIGKITLGEPRRTDRNGNILKVGDRVKFLTEGRFTGKFWTIYRLTEKRVLCERKKSGQKTHREYRNVQKVLE